MSTGIYKAKRLVHPAGLRKTHDYELWCAKDHPHPKPPQFSKADMAKIRAELRAQRAEREAAATEAPGRVEH